MLNRAISQCGVGLHRDGAHSISDPAFWPSPEIPTGEPQDWASAKTLELPGLALESSGLVYDG